MQFMDLFTPRILKALGKFNVIKKNSARVVLKVTL